VAVFVDGDFWHGKQWKSRGFDSLEQQMSRVNGSQYWIKKLSRNIERDIEVNQKLADLGWQVVRVWESDIRSDLDSVSEQIRLVVKESSLAH
jgi:DNA mismatch endonuclease (patch repair protein)